jgi:uncharacterized protein
VVRAHGAHAAFIEPWLRHQRRDGYWRHGSVCEDYARIEAPVYAIGGWADGYTNAIPRLLAGLPGPRKGLIGPWSHAFPQDGEPGPAIGFLQECLRWWDHWLKDADTGIMDEPMLRAWMQEPVAPAGWHAERPGRWVAESAWPSSQIATSSWALGPDGLIPGGPELHVPGAPEQPLRHRSPETIGQDAGAWCADGGAGDWPVDQRAEDGRSLAFTSAPLEESLEILGSPAVVLELAADRPQALIAVRLCDVAPGGSSLLVTRGLLNLTRRDDMDASATLEPGERYAVRVRLDAIGQRIPAGHRLRVAISTAYWPWAWPAPASATLTVFAGPACRLELRVRPPRDADSDLAPFGEAEWSEPLEQEVLRSDPTSRTLTRDLATGAHELTFRWDVGGRRRLTDTGAELDDTNLTTYRIVDGDPLSAGVRCRCASTLARGDWHTRVETDSRMTATATEFLVTRPRRVRGRQARLRAHVDAAVPP